MRIFSQLLDHALWTSETCMGFRQPLRLPSVSWGCVHLSQLTRTPCVITGLMCTYFDSLATLCFTGLVCTCGSLAQPLCCRACVFFRLPRPTLCTCGLCALERFVCHAFLGNLGMPSAPSGLCALERFVCCATQLPRPALCTARVVCAGEVCMLPLPRQPGLPSVLWGFYGLFSVARARCLVGATVYVPFIG